jgi:exopolysaccharide production protein ExoQ
MTAIIYSLVVFVAAIIGVIAYGAILHWGRHREVGLLPYIFYPVIINVLLQISATKRNLFLMISSELSENVVVLPAYTLWMSRVTSVFIMLGASERIINRLLRYHKGSPTPVGLSLAFAFFFVTTVLFSAFLGTNTSISHEYFYLFLGGSAALLFTQAEGEAAIRAARNAIFLCLLASAACLLVKPELVMFKGYNEGVIPGLTIRYFGLTSHANSLGPITVVFLLCLWSRPYPGGINTLAWVVGIATLVLAQSKTSWICFSLSVPCMLYFRYGALIARYLFDFRRPVFLVTFLMGGMLVLMGAVMVIMFGPLGNPLSSFFYSQAGADLMSMTGRNEIWAVALREWNRNPLFGYGLTIWDEKHRARIGIPAAVTAHSQFYQTLASAGIVGVAGLIVYAVTLLRYALKTVRVSQGLTLSFFLLLFMRSISEVPLTMVGYYGPDELTHILILMVIASHFSLLVSTVANKHGADKTSALHYGSAVSKEIHKTTKAELT